MSDISLSFGSNNSANIIIKSNNCKIGEEYYPNFISEYNVCNKSIDTSNISNTSNTTTIIEKIYENYYEFELTSGVKKILILDTILTETDINIITNNDKTLIKKAYISNNCIEISSNTFKNCTELTYISYINYTNLRDASLTIIGSSAFENCINLRECKLFDISNSINNISEYAFYGCSKLIQAQIQNSSSLQILGRSAFELCTKLNTIIFEQSNININDECFKNSGLVNITFNQNLPSTFDTNIFQDIPENATVYYNSNFISGENYNLLKSKFPNSGANIIFIDIINNIIENNETFYNITNDVTLNLDVTQVKTIIDSLILKRNGSTTYSINIISDNSLQGTNTLGWANWLSKTIGLNPDNTDNTGIYLLNNIPYNINVVVLLHEILHIFGYGVGNLWDSYKTLVNFSNNYFYNGSNGVYQYNRLLYNNGYSETTFLNYFAIEDSGGAGTEGSHSEEGYYLASEGFIPQIRYDLSGRIYPSFEYEIMTGFLDSNNYLTIQSLGVMQDLGFSVNYDSSYCYKGSISYLPDIS